MSTVEGKLVTCNVCGKRKFLALVSTTEHDGGFTKVRHYESLPEGWNEVRVAGTYDLCPECSKRLAEAISTTIDKIRSDDRCQK